MSELVSTGQTIKDAKAKLAGILKKVAASLDTAEGLEREAEALEAKGDAERAGQRRAAAANYRSNAERMMKEYRISEEQLIAADPAAVEPVWETIDLCDAGNVFQTKYLQLWWGIIAHVGVEARCVYAGTKVVANAVGYDGDLRYAMVLYAEARMGFAAKLDPKVDETLTDLENVYRLRSAGIPRNRIANLLWGASMASDGAPSHGKVGKLYKEACALRGEDATVSGRTVNAGTYRETYAEEFVTRYRARLREARNAADSTGGALELHGRKERVQEAFWTRYPELRPSDVPAPKPEPCATCVRRAKAGEGPCRKHAPRAWTKKDDAEWSRRHESAAALAGRAAGRAAADEIEIERAARAKRIEPGWHPDWSELGQ